MFGFKRRFDHNDEYEAEGFRHRKHHHHFAPKSHGRGPFGGDFGGGGRKRQRRGDIKFILLQLIKEQPRHGYDLIKALEEQYGGFYRPSPGSVYPTLQLLEDEGHLRSETINGKRIYTITEMGEKLLAEREQAQPDHGEREHFGRHGHGFAGRGGEWGSSDTLRNDLRHTTEALIESIMQAGRFGTPDQIKAAQELISKTNQEVHKILARNSETPADKL